jgi:predicted metal-binding protein
MFCKVVPVLDFSVRKLCYSPYYKHKKGCPNWNKKEGCPPKLPTIDKILNLKRTIYVIYNKFNFLEHTNRMRLRHPDWSDKQVECCLYWQGSARKCLREEIKKFIKEHRSYYIESCPEGAGVDITKTMKKIDIELEWPPKKYTYQVVLAGIKNL